jgi:small GTP-binding protein
MLLGDSGVGKSSILHWFSDGQFVNNLIGTAGIDFRNKVVEINNAKIKLEIWDTAGQEKF